MYHTGELVVYGTTGVCRVEGVARPETPGRASGTLYYLLKPLQQDGVIYTPVDSGKVPMRPVMTAQEAEALIDRIPTMEAEAVYSPTLQALAQHYQDLLRTSDCQDLLRLTMSIYTKQQAALAKKKRLGLVDERYMKQAERMLHGELAAALGIPFEEVQPYIARRVAGAPAGTAREELAQ